MEYEVYTDEEYSEEEYNDEGYGNREYSDISEEEDIAFTSENDTDSTMMVIMIPSTQ